MFDERKCSEVLKRLISLLMLLSLMPIPAKAEKETVIVQVTDLHYLSPALTDYGEKFMALIESGDGKVVHYTPQIVSAFVQEMLALQPDAVILSGDLTFNGEPQSHMELAALLQPLADAGISVLALSGNHDSGSITWAYSDAGYQAIDGFPDDQFDDVYAHLGYDAAIARDNASQSYVARVKDVRILLVDVNTNGTASSGVTGYVKDESLIWIESQLRAARDAGETVIAVSHQPLLVHNSMFVAGKVITNADALLRLYAQYGVQVNLAGHLHLQHIVEQDGLTEFVTGALSVAPIEYAVLTLSEGRPMTYETRPVDVSAWAAAQGVTNPELLDFSTYAWDYFDRITTSQVSAMLSRMDIPEEHADRMTALAIRLNREYFAGTRAPSAQDRDIELWTTYAPTNFFTRYLNSVMEDAKPGNRYTFR